jgi:LmbE family N-acetylglucosaminyl deacetylase
MRALNLLGPGAPLSVLCLGAHSDDIEIGAGGTVMTWIATGANLKVHWCVLTGHAERQAEAEASAAAFLQGAEQCEVEFAGFRDGFLPYQGAQLKEWMLEVRGRVSPDVVLTHRSDDAHQDHREISRLTWNSFRDDLILEYEIPKWDGDLGRPNLYVPLTHAIMERKVDLLLSHFGTQRSKDWFDSDTFRGLARLRGMECRAREGFAEAFNVRKAVIA